MLTVDERIETVEAIALRAELDEAFGYAQAWVEERSALLVRLESTSGLVGWGECWGPIAGTRETIERFLGPKIVGRNPLHVESIHEDLFQVSRAAYQSTVPLPAISGIDIALWDLVGKIRDSSISQLVGAPPLEAVRAYATGHYFREGLNLPDQFDAIAAEAQRNAEEYGAVKLKIGLQLLGYGPREDVELVRHVREVVGDDVALMVDANYAYDAAIARGVGNALEDEDVHWFEEPVHPENYAGYVELRRGLDVHIAGGECHSPADFHRLFEAGGLDIAQPDLCNVGGITSGREVATMADAAHTRVVPHVWGTPVAIAASLQFIGSLPPTTWLEFDTSPNPLRDELSVAKFRPDADGRIRVPDGPGLGIELRDRAINEFRV